MVKRNVCFNPGPAAVPLDVLKIIQEELLDYKGTGMSILESFTSLPRNTKRSTTKSPCW